MNITVSFNYIEELENIYRDARWEAYYDPVIIPIIRMCCLNKNVKIVPVHETRKAGRKPKVYKNHFIETYSIEDEGKRKGIPDYVIVPIDSTYDCPKKSFVNIEFKMPNFEMSNDLINGYTCVHPKDYEDELRHQMEYCDYIIFTDGVTWYFLKKKIESESGYQIKHDFCLYDMKHNCWKYEERDAFSTHEIEFFNTFGIEYDVDEKIKVPPNEWKDLLSTIRNWIDESKK